ncbi:MAG: thioesterase family protein [Pseudomonadota bacterium]
MTTLLDDCPVTVEIPVAWGEMDAFQHVNNVAYFRYFETVRIAYFTALDLMATMQETGIGPILAETRCRFRIPLTYPDTLTVGARVSALEGDRFIMDYRVASARHGKVAAEGDGILVTFDYTAGNKVPIPEALERRIRALERLPVGRING